MQKTFLREVKAVSKGIKKLLAKKVNIGGIPNWLSVGNLKKTENRTWDAKNSSSGTKLSVAFKKKPLFSYPSETLKGILKNFEAVSKIVVFKQVGVTKDIGGSIDTNIGIKPQKRALDTIIQR